jgi:hypothetical protein
VDLALRSLQRGQRQAREHIAAASERHLAGLRRTGTVLVPGQDLAQSRDAVVDLHRPARLAGEPLGQPASMLPDLAELPPVGPAAGQQRLPEQRAQGPAPLLGELGVQHVAEP